MKLKIISISTSLSSVIDTINTNSDNLGLIRSLWKEFVEPLVFGNPDLAQLNDAKLKLKIENTFRIFCALGDHLFARIVYVCFPLIDINSESATNRTALGLAIESGNEELFIDLLGFGARLSKVETMNARLSIKVSLFREKLGTMMRHFNRLRSCNAVDDEFKKLYEDIQQPILDIGGGDGTLAKQLGVFSNDPDKYAILEPCISQNGYPKTLSNWCYLGCITPKSVLLHNLLTSIDDYFLIQVIISRLNHILPTEGTVYVLTDQCPSIRILNEFDEIANNKIEGETIDQQKLRLLELFKTIFEDYGFTQINRVEKFKKSDPTHRMTLQIFRKLPPS